LQLLNKVKIKARKKKYKCTRNKNARGPRRALLGRKTGDKKETTGRKGEYLL